MLAISCLVEGVGVDFLLENPAEQNRLLRSTPATIMPNYNIKRCSNLSKTEGVGVEPTGLLSKSKFSKLLHEPLCVPSKFTLILSLLLAAGNN